MVVLPGVLWCRPLRRTVHVRLGTNTLRLPGGTTIFVVSRQQFMTYPAGLSRGMLEVALTSKGKIFVSGRLSVVRCQKTHSAMINALLTTDQGRRTTDGTSLGWDVPAALTNLRD